MSGRRKAPGPDPQRCAVLTPDYALPGGVLCDQTGVHPVPLDAVLAYDAPETVDAIPSPFRDHVTLCVAANADAERDGLPPTFQVAGRPHLYAGPALIVGYDDTDGTVALTVDELWWVLARVYVLTSTGGDAAHVVWLLALREAA